MHNTYLYFFPKNLSPKFLYHLLWSADIIIISLNLSHNDFFLHCDFVDFIHIFIKIEWF